MVLMSPAGCDIHAVLCQPDSVCAPVHLLNVWMHAWMNAGWWYWSQTGLVEWLALAVGHKGCGGPGALTQLLVKGTAAVTEGCVFSTRSEAASPFSFSDSGEGAASAATYLGTWVGMVIPFHSRWAF